VKDNGDDFLQIWAESKEDGHGKGFPCPVCSCKTPLKLISCLSELDGQMVVTFRCPNINCVRNEKLLIEVWEEQPLQGLNIFTKLNFKKMKMDAKGYAQMRYTIRSQMEYFIPNFEESIQAVDKKVESLPKMDSGPKARIHDITRLNPIKRRFRRKPEHSPSSRETIRKLKEAKELKDEIKEKKQRERFKPKEEREHG
jgi:hypothetical protein